MKVLVIIVTYNAMQWIDCCLGSVRDSYVKLDVYIVDNGSTDGTQDYIKNHFPEYHFIQSNENHGFGKANNLGLQYALDNKYDYVYLLNQDAWIFPDTIEKLIDVSKRNTDYGILSPFQMEANMLHLDENFKKTVCRWESSPELLDDLYFNTGKDIIAVQEVMAAHWLITKACLMRVGGFSPSFHHYAEDDNYQDRVRYHGMNIGVVPSVRAVHDRQNRQNSSKKEIYLSYTRVLRYLSNPIGSNHSFMHAVYLMVKDVLLYKSLLPINYIGSILCQLRKIRANLKISQNEVCAFLKS